MLGHISNLHTEAALSLVDNKFSGLEQRAYFPLLRIEVSQSHEVSEKPVEITENIKCLVYRLDVASLFGESCILGHKGKKSLLCILFSKFLQGIKSQGLYSFTLLCTLPRHICCELASYSIPILLNEDLLVSCRCRYHCIELSCPSRIYRSRQINLRLAVNP